MSDEQQQIEPWAVVIESDSPPLLLEHINEFAVTLQPDAELTVITVGEQGPAGAPGTGLSNWQVNEW